MSAVPLPLGGNRRHFGLAVQCCFHLVGESRASEGNGGTQREHGKHDLVRHGSLLPVGIEPDVSFKTTAVPELFP